MKARPHVRIRPYTWKHPDGTDTPGIALMHGLSVKAHLTAQEALNMADTLVDLAETPRVTYTTRTALPLIAADGTEDHPLPVTTAEQE